MGKSPLFQKLFVEFSIMEAIEVTDFGFWALRKVRVFPSGTFDSPSSSSARWVACSSTFGITVCAAPKGKLVAYKTSDLHTLIPSSTNFAHEVTDVPSKTVAFHDSQAEIAFLDSDCDGRFFSVATNSSQGPFVHIFDFRLFSFECSVQPFPIRSIRLSEDTSSRITCVEWNPAVGGMFSAASSDNTLCTYQIDTSQPGNFTLVGKVRLNDCVTCISWSPKGKQLVTGHAAGKMSQYKPELALVRHVDAPTNISSFGNAMVKCVGLCWISTTEWLIAYSPLNDTKKVNFSLLTVKKEQPPNWVHMDDITFGDTKSAIPLAIRMFPIHNWQMVLCSSSCSGEVVVVGKMPNTTSWKCWSLEQRFDVPTAVNQSPTCGIGLAMDISSVQNIIPLVGGTSAIPPSPLIMNLLTDGVLISCWATPQNPGLKSFNAAVKSLEAGGSLFNGVAPAGYKPRSATVTPAAETKNVHPTLTSTPSIATVTEEKSAVEKAAEKAAADRAALEKAALEKAAAEKAALEKAAAEKAEADRIAAEKAAKAAEKAAAEKAEAERQAALEAERRRVEKEMQDLQELLSKNLSFIEATGRNLEECRAVSDKAREAHDNYDRDRVMLAFDNLDDMEDYQLSLQRAISALIKTLRDAHAQLESGRVSLRKLQQVKDILSTHDSLNFDEAQRMNKTSQAMIELERSFIEVKKSLGNLDKNCNGDGSSLFAEMCDLSLNASKPQLDEEDEERMKMICQCIAGYQRQTKLLENKLRNVECALSAKNNPSKLDETWDNQPTSFFGKKEKMNDSNSKSTERQELHIGKMERRIYGTDMADIAVQRANIRKFIAKLEDETIRVHQPKFLTARAVEKENQNHTVVEEKDNDVSSNNLEKKLKAVSTPKPKGVTVGTQSPNFGGISMLDSPLRDTVNSRRFSTMVFAPKGISTPLAVPVLKESLEPQIVSTPVITSQPQIITPQQPNPAVNEASKPSFGTPAISATLKPATSTPIFSAAQPAGSPGVKTPVSVVNPPSTSSFFTPVSSSIPVAATPSPIVAAVPNTIVPTPSPVVPASAPTTVPSTNEGALFKAVATSNESKEVVKPVVVDSHPKPLPVSATTAAVATTSSTAAPSIFGTPPAAPTVVTSVTSTATATPSSFSFKPAQTSAGTTASSFSFKPQQPASEVKPVFGGFGTQKSSSPFGGSSAAGAPSATSASTVAFSFSKPVESKPSVFGKPAESAPVNVVSSADEGMMEDDSPADSASGAKSGSLFSSSGFLSGMGSAAPKGEVKNVFGGAINKPATGTNASSWLFAKSGSSPQHSQQTAQPSSFSFKPSNAGTSSTFGKAAFGGGASPFSGGSSFGTASFGGKPAFGASATPATGAGFASFASAASGGGFAKFAQQGSNGFGAAPTGSTFGGSSMASAPSSTFGGGNTSSFSNQGSSFTSWR
ncbi:hypothetical protein QR680_000412 [Steinernema hermaphroditum]|uniref:Nucleoporin Nup159/Nup146 N-terminal domain-containing protein n=1 Tax=Steinernema hermaphroditum TaxID=289476 RepID=A0AA39GUH6_9BILA|nr:hypothetical protein QR680_000412 [Steinernema hermaphroditum]